MDPETMRGEPGLGGDVYWRRRMSLLIAVLVVVAVVAWACSGSSGPEERSDAKPSPSPAPVTDPLLAGLRTLTTGTASPSPSPSPSRSPRPRRAGEPCKENDLVLHLQGKQEIYPKGTRPHFIVTVVNTGPVMCRTDVGPRALEIRITSGDDRIWSTADCVSGPGTDTRELKRGVPYVRSLDWNRRRSSGDCRADPPAALPGTYVVVARLGEHRSPRGVFHLR
ncbi:hypothetical protein OUY22_10150 [Nonomuraea sp. MCN248]|uniref:DUF4232 domain-containing protein n=1 Tax=Nonomuraea corallina TaxID=2989783 RepID=A0ABT4SA09_9ACTN|nr:hypothetical protein [Nonomuraea corallina]MDA0633780.1 hypothetical protein [Nonomuraea corallina]